MVKIIVVMVTKDWNTPLVVIRKESESIPRWPGRISRQSPDLGHRLLFGFAFPGSNNCVSAVHVDKLQESISHRAPPVQLVWSISYICGAPISFLSIDLNVTFFASLNSTRWISKNLVKLEVWNTTSWLLSLDGRVWIVASVMVIWKFKKVF